MTFGRFVGCREGENGVVMMFVDSRGEVSETQVWVGFDNVIFAEDGAVEVWGEDGADADITFGGVSGDVLISFS